MTATQGFELRSNYDAASRSVSLELTVGSSGLPAGSLVALTSVVQLTPATDTGPRLMHRLATYHEFAIDTGPLEPSVVWRPEALTPSHAPRHSNDGPASGFVILPDGSTNPMVVVPMTRDDVPSIDPLGQAPANRPTGEPTGTTTEPAVVPFPRVIEIGDPTPITTTSATMTGDHAPARAAWDAVSALEHRTTTDPCLHPTGGIPVDPVDEPMLDSEEYRVAIEDGQITVAASTIAGFRHAFVTLARWLPAGLPSRAHIEDRPEYSWRGLHIDLARQWFEPELVERLIDMAAWRKLSRLHLHLTDDEAWRVPIGGYPELAAVGATRGHGLPLEPMLGGAAEASGRCYTIDEIARWVERADELGIILVPEVDLPAHNHAALVAVPRLRDPDDRSGAVSVQSFTDNVMVPGHPLLPDFLDRVVDSVAALFPTSPWIHVGGDEVPDGAWAGSPMVAEYRARNGLTTTRDVEGGFHRDLADRVHTRSGRRIGAWQEAAESGGVRPDDGYVIGWRTPEASRKLAAAGYDVVVAPGQAYYLDMAIDDRWDEPGAWWAGTVSLDDVCSFVPDEGWSDAERSHLLGVQACLWTEHVISDGLVDRMLFPRLDAVAERAWTGEIIGAASSLAIRAGQRD